MQPSSIVRTEDVPVQPWRNGGGVMRELLVRPGGEAWQLRVGVAEIAADGPFSFFPGVARRFALLDGAGVALTIDGAEHACGPGDDALAFAGDASTHCRLVDGPARALNLLLHGVSGSLRRVVAATPWRPEGRECGLYAIGAGRCSSSARVEPEAMPAHALRWWPDAPDELRFDAAGWWLSVGAKAAP